MCVCVEMMYFFKGRNKDVCEYFHQCAILVACMTLLKNTSFPEKPICFVLPILVMVPTHETYNR